MKYHVRTNFNNFFRKFFIFTFRQVFFSEYYRNIVFIKLPHSFKKVFAKFSVRHAYNIKHRYNHSLPAVSPAPQSLYTLLQRFSGLKFQIVHHPFALPNDRRYQRQLRHLFCSGNINNIISIAKTACLQWNFSLFDNFVLITSANKTPIAKAIIGII